MRCRHDYTVSIASESSFTLGSTQSCECPITRLNIDAIDLLSFSANAKHAFALAKEQERTQQLQFESQISQARAMEEEWKQQTVKVQGEERRLNIQEEAKYHREKANYEDQLARKRYEDQLMSQRQSQDEMLRKQEESTKKQEDLRRC